MVQESSPPFPTLAEAAFYAGLTGLATYHQQSALSIAPLSEMASTGLDWPPL
jgi:hypothetical protein